MKALCIRQPWAWLIVNGYKTIENRDWITKYRGPLLILASRQHADPDADRFARKKCARMGIPLPESFEYGGVVGQVELVDCINESRDPWFEGEFGFVLANPRPLHPMKGKLGLFAVPPEQLPELGGEALVPHAVLSGWTERQTAPRPARRWNLQRFLARIGRKE